MTGTQKNRKKRGRKKYFIVFIVIFSLLFVKTSYRYSQKNVSSVVEAGDVSRVSFNVWKSAINIAFEYEKSAMEAEKARIAREKMEKEAIERELREKSGVKVAYLTFDDGPSSNVTPQILDILKEYDVKATFFVIGNLAEQYPELIKRIHDEGHAIGNHTYSHNYKYIYKNTANFIEELKSTEKVFKNILGNEYETKLVRFPGGSFGSKRASFRKAVVDNGYIYYDWNSLNGDAEGKNIPKNRLIQRFKNTANGKNTLLVLMHDMGAKKTTVEALPEIIEYLQQNDYEFDILK